MADRAAGEVGLRGRFTESGLGQVRGFTRQRRLRLSSPSPRHAGVCVSAMVISVQRIRHSLHGSSIMSMASPPEDGGVTWTLGLCEMMFAIALLANLGALSHNSILTGSFSEHWWE